MAASPATSSSPTATSSLTPPRTSSLLTTVRPFLIGGTSGCIATTIIQPIDFVKVRLQLLGAGTHTTSTAPRVTPFSVAREVIRSGRLLDFYSGLSAGIARQLVYGTSRLGFFFTFEDQLKQRAARHSTSYGFRERAVAGLGAGALGSFIGNPTEVALIRMQSDGLQPSSQRANYKSVFDALARITRNEGILALWSGCLPTVIRAMSTNFGQLAFFSEAKHQMALHTRASEQMRSVVASGVAGLAASVFSLPFDFLKTRLQRQSNHNTSVGGSQQYKGMWDCARKVVREEGVLRFYRGFGTYCARIAPHSVITLIIADKIAASFR